MVLIRINGKAREFYKSTLIPPTYYTPPSLPSSIGTVSSGPRSRAICALLSPALMRWRAVTTSSGVSFFFRPPIHTLALGNGNALPLRFADNHALELGESSEHWEQQDRE